MAGIFILALLSISKAYPSGSPHTQILDKVEKPVRRKRASLFSLYIIDYFILTCTMKTFTTVVNSNLTDSTLRTGSKPLTQILD
jgi:hypothetical protein